MIIIGKPFDYEEGNFAFLTKVSISEDTAAAYLAASKVIKKSTLADFRKLSAKGVETT